MPELVDGILSIFRDPYEKSHLTAAQILLVTDIAFTIGVPEPFESAAKELYLIFKSDPTAKDALFSPLIFGEHEDYPSLIKYLKTLGVYDNQIPHPDLPEHTIPVFDARPLLTLLKKMPDRDPVSGLVLGNSQINKHNSVLKNNYGRGKTTDYCKITSRAKTTKSLKLPEQINVPRGVLVAQNVVEASHREIILAKSAKLRAAYAALKYSREVLRCIKCIIADEQGQVLRHNRRRTTINQSISRCLLGVATLFEVNRKHEYVHFANRFDIFGCRSTSLAEICEFMNRVSGSRRRVTQKQAARGLDELCRLGLIERKTKFSLEQFPVPLAILFRADRVLQSIRGRSFGLKMKSVNRKRHQLTGVRQRTQKSNTVVTNN